MNSIDLSIGIFAYLVIGLLIYLLYRRQTEKPKLWKVFVIVFIGLFCFSINWTVAGSVIKIPILPLGVWILYFFLRKHKARWWVYRPYAWLGFSMNLILLAATLSTIPIHHAVYPPDEPTTYISNVENASVINTHPVAEDMFLDKKLFLQKLHTMSQKPVAIVDWFEEGHQSINSEKPRERFPYQLVGASSEWGSGVNAIIYIEKDGKGILCETPEKQLYFRSDVPFLKEANEVEGK